MPAPDKNDDDQPAGVALLAGMTARLDARQGRDAPIYRVVELTREADGRLRRQGQIWHADLDQVRRFGRAVAANSVAQQVVIADSAGGVVEELSVAPAAGPAGWAGWRELPLPPAPPRRKPRVAPRPVVKAAPAAAVPAAAPGVDLAVPAVDASPSTITSMTRQPPPRDLPVVRAEVATLSGAAVSA